jgi:hypothetical protein
MAFDLQDGTVLKMAWNDQGISQNQSEIQTFQRAKATGLQDVLASITQSAHDKSWLVMEKVSPVTEQEFANLAGVTFQVMRMVLKRFNEFGLMNQTINAIRADVQHDAQRAPERYKDGALLKDLEQSRNSEFLEKLTSVVEVGALNPGDLFDISHWGKTENGRLVILDYGMNDATASSFY